MTTFKFHCGDSNDGPIGFAAEVKADSMPRAIKLLQDALPEHITVQPNQGTCWDGKEGVTYIAVFFNPAKVVWKHIYSEDEIPVHPEPQ